MFILSLLIVLVGGYIIGYLTSKIKLPKIVGMIIFGILIGPSVLNIISPSLIKISPILRKIALVIIITRAGLNLNIGKMKREEVLISFLPATLEMLAVMLFSFLLLDVSLLEGLLLGTVLAAVSPAVLVPRMIKLKDEGYEKVPNLILFGSSVDDVFVIVIFYVVLNMLKTNTFDLISIIQIPSSIILGIVLGVLIGYLASKLFNKFKVNKYLKVLLILIITMGLVFSEDYLFKVINVTTLLSVLAMNIVINKKSPKEVKEVHDIYKYLWFVFEILLFVLVGISIDLKFAYSNGFLPVLVLFIGLIFRSVGTILATLKSNYSLKEKLFTVLAYLPKATVQASIGWIAVAEGLEVGNLVLTSAVISILITAPLGAILIANTYKKLLIKDSLYIEK